MAMVTVMGVMDRAWTWARARSRTWPCSRARPRSPRTWTWTWSRWTLVARSLVWLGRTMLGVALTDRLGLDLWLGARGVMEKAPHAAERGLPVSVSSNNLGGQESAPRAPKRGFCA